MDAAEPPRVVFESTSECTDRERVEEVVRQALGTARAPTSGWVVTIRITPGAPPGVSAEGEIADGSGASRAHSTLAGEAADCEALGKAMSAWAVGVLQAPQAEDKSVSAAPLPPLPPAPPSAPSAARIERAESLAAASSNSPPSPAESAEYEMPTLELGTGVFLMAGGAAGGYAGVSPFLIDEIGEGIFLRPSISVGRAVSTSFGSTWAAGRLDTCTRLPGRYASRNGIQLDLCGGPDVGFSYVSSGTQPGSPREGKALPYVALGPSADLRAEIGDVAVSLRVVAGLNVARAAFVDVAGTSIDESAWSWRFEMAFSGSLRHTRR